MGMVLFYPTIPCHCYPYRQTQAGSRKVPFGPIQSTSPTPPSTANMFPRGMHDRAVSELGHSKHYIYPNFYVCFSLKGFTDSILAFTLDNCIPLRDITAIKKIPRKCRDTSVPFLLVFSRSRKRRYFILVVSTVLPTFEVVQGQGTSDPIDTS
jgi:hypothetical protein